MKYILPFEINKIISTNIQNQIALNLGIQLTDLLNNLENQCINLIQNKLSKQYDLDKEFKPYTSWSVGTTGSYYGGDRLLVSGSIYNCKYPNQQFDSIKRYELDEQVFYKNNIYKYNPPTYNYYDNYLSPDGLSPVYNNINNKILDYNPIPYTGSSVWIYQSTYVIENPLIIIGNPFFIKETDIPFNDDINRPRNPTLINWISTLMVSELYRTIDSENIPENVKYYEKLTRLEIQKTNEKIQTINNLPLSEPKYKTSKIIFSGYINPNNNIM